ncbi:MAG: hypothetical protein C5B50_18620 [Verrucomicrobia bacterium]|nr:MAG: hypothetical protein C5B50_18620 [Verrucomicrobiota bacterium]
MTLTSLLLAGGSSSRMGLDKATVMFQGKPLWSRQLSLLRALLPEVLRVSARSIPEWCPPEAQIILDETAQRGPLSGIAAALARLQTSHLLVLAVDLPRMTGEHLRKLKNLATEGTGIVPFNGEFFEPVCAIYPKKAAEFAAEAIARKQISMQRFVRRLVERELVQAYNLTEDEKPLYSNLNTPEDLKNCT